MTWLGVDVGGARKGFDVALVDDTSAGDYEAFGAIVVPKPSQ